MIGIKPHLRRKRGKREAVCAVKKVGKARESGGGLKK